MRTALVAVLLLVAASCRALPSHDENGPSAYFDIFNAGDSYAAGNAATVGGDNDGYFFQSPDDPRAEADVRQRSSIGPSKDCYRNENNYSQTLYELLGSAGAHINGACSGDTTAEVLNTNGSDGQLNGFTAEQMDEVDLITISIGGNDLEFREVVEHCFGPLRSVSNCNNNLFAAETKLANEVLHDPMEDVLELLISEDKFTNAHVVLVGYPLFWEGPLPLGDNDETAPADPVQRLRFGLEELNLQQEELVDELNVNHPGRFAFLPLHLPDTNDDGTGEAFFDGHGIGGSSSDQWIQNIAGTVYSGEWVHPTAAGHAATAQALYDMQFVQDAFNERVQADYPKMSLTEVDGQWYALDNNGELWSIAGDFTLCEEAEGYTVVSPPWRDPSQVFDAAVNGSPYSAKVLSCTVSWVEIGSVLDFYSAEGGYILSGLVAEGANGFPITAKSISPECKTFLLSQGRPTFELYADDPRTELFGYDTTFTDEECFALTWP